MREPVRKIDPIPESYSPKDKPEILSMVQASAFVSDTITDPFIGGEPPRTSNRILNYRRIQPWENYFLASAICSVAVAVGVDRDALEHLGSERVNSGFHFFSAFTGDAAKLLPLYRQLVAYKDEIWAIHGNFFPPMDKFRTHEFRAQIAKILRRIGGICDVILKV